MYWRTSKIDVNNERLPHDLVVPELYLSTDDYAPMIKFDLEDLYYPWCVMRPFGTKYGSEFVNRFQSFKEAYDFLSDLLEKETGT